MNNVLRLWLAVLLAIMITGCDLPRYPIDDPPVVKIDTRLLGTWVNKKDKNTLVIVSKQNDYQYLVSIKEKGNKKTENYTAFLSKVNNLRFINVYCKNDSGDSYLLLRLMDINPANNRITTATIADSTMQYLTSAGAVKDYIAKNIDNPALYKDTGYLYKVR